jgi:hypothetical protein
MLRIIHQVSSESESGRFEVLDLLRDSIGAAIGDLYDEGVYHEDLSDALRPENVTGDLSERRKRASRVLLRRLSDAALTRLLSDDGVTITVSKSGAGQREGGDS